MGPRVKPGVTAGDCKNTALIPHPALGHDLRDAVGVAGKFAPVEPFIRRRRTACEAPGQGVGVVTIERRAAIGEECGGQEGLWRWRDGASNEGFLLGDWVGLWRGTEIYTTKMLCHK